MIITVTLNPCYDKVAEVDTLCIGELNRMQNVVVHGSGKGVNVALTIRSLGGDCTAAGFMGTGGEGILQRLEENGARHDFVQVRSRTRTNLKVLDKSGAMTELNEPGLTVEQAECDALFQKLEAYATPKTVFTLSGSLPQGVCPDIYLRLAQMMRRHGARVILDTDGEPLRQALDAPPDFIKPNRFELLQFFGAKPDGRLIQLRDLCRRLLALGPKAAVLSMGADGAMYVDEKTCLYTPALPVQAHSTAGAGDAIVAVMAMAMDSGKPLREAFPLAVAASAGAVTTCGTCPADAQLVQQLSQQIHLQAVE